MLLGLFNCTTGLTKFETSFGFLSSGFRKDALEVKLPNFQINEWYWEGT